MLRGISTNQTAGSGPPLLLFFPPRVRVRAHGPPVVQLSSQKRSNVARNYVAWTRWFGPAEEGVASLVRSPVFQPMHRWRAMSGRGGKLFMQEVGA